MLYGFILKEGGQIPKYRILVFPVFPVFPAFWYRYNTDTEPVFVRISVSHIDTGFAVFSVRFGIGIHHWSAIQEYFFFVHMRWIDIFPFVFLCFLFSIGCFQWGGCDRELVACGMLRLRLFAVWICYGLYLVGGSLWQTPSLSKQDKYARNMEVQCGTAVVLYMVHLIDEQYNYSKQDGLCNHRCFSSTTALI